MKKIIAVSALALTLGFLPLLSLTAASPRREASTVPV